MKEFLITDVGNIVRCYKILGNNKNKKGKFLKLATMIT